MMPMATHQTLCRHFAGLLDYPDVATQQSAEACLLLLRDARPEAVAPLERFIGFLAAEPPRRIEETFTATFDLQPLCHPYVGYQLCGETQKRALFLMQLQQIYKRHGFTVTGELPDHLATILRFLATIDESACRDEILHDGLIPALEKILASLDEKNHPYAALLGALRLFLTNSPSDHCQKEFRS